MGQEVVKYTVTGMQNYDNNHLILRCIERDPLAWAEFVRRFSPIITFSVKRALIIYTGAFSASEIEDIKQGILVLLWEKNKLMDIIKRSRIEYWLSIISMNMSINHLRAKKREVPAGDMSFFENTPCANRAHPLDSILIREEIERFLTRLNSREKIIFRLRFEKERKDAEIAGILNTSRNSVTKTISRIRKKLKNMP